MKNLIIDGRSIIVEGADNSDILGGSFRNFKGAERKDPHTGRTVNTEGKRNFNLRIPEDKVKALQNLGINVKSFGGDDESGEPPIYFVKVNVNTQTSNNPPVIQKKKPNGDLEEIPVSSYDKIDGVFFDNVNLAISIYSKFSPSSLYMNLMVYKEHMDPVTEKYSYLFESNNIDPNAPDADSDEEIPFN